MGSLDIKMHSSWNCYKNGFTFAKLIAMHVVSKIVSQFEICVMHKGCSQGGGIMGLKSPSLGHFWLHTCDAHIVQISIKCTQNSLRLINSPYKIPNSNGSTCELCSNMVPGLHVHVLHLWETIIIQQWNLICMIICVYCNYTYYWSKLISQSIDYTNWFLVKS